MNRARARRLLWIFRPMVVAVSLGTLLAQIGPAPTHAANVAVTASVESHISLTNNCTAPGAYQLGSVPPGSSVTTSVGADVCSLSWSSNNDTSMLRMYQRDGAGSAMGADVTSNTKQLARDTAYRDVTFAPGSTTVAWAVGDDRAIARTSDGGSTWTAQSACGSGWTFHAVGAANGSDIWAVGQGPAPYMCRSGDGGSTWSSPATSPPIPSWITITDVEVVSGLEVYVTGYAGTAYKTMDGGGSWSAMTSGLDTGIDYYEIESVGGGVLYLLGMNKVYRSNDSGASWSLQANLTCGGYVSLSALDANTAYAVSDNGCMSRTTDGSTWSQLASRPYGLRSIVVVAANLVYASGDRGQLYRSTDGITFAPVDPNGSASYLGMAATATQAIIVGTGKARNHSTNGTSWTRSGVQTPSWYGVDAVNGNVAWVVGADRSIRATTDGGSTWLVQGTPSGSYHLFAVDAVSASTAYASGTAGTLLRTTDGGTTWTSVPSGVSEDLLDVCAGSSSIIIAVGKSGRVVRSADGGSTWSSVSSGVTTDLQACDMASSSVGWAVGHSGTILKTTDGGISWTPQSGGAYQPIMSVSAVDANVAWVTGGWSWVARTTDGGATAWQAVVTRPGMRAQSVSALDANTAFINGYDYVKRTTDAGTSWSAVVQHWTHGLDIVALDRSSSFASATGNLIMRTAPKVSVSDYGTSSNFGSGGTTDAFGVCLQAVGATTTPVWMPDSTNVAGRCETLDTDPWNAVPPAATKIAQAAAGATGRVDLVFGFRSKAAAAPGTYSATVVVEAVAPAV